ncbi:MAG: hypothetical protein V1735_03820 [Nanoarchaeota archaeon]
MELRQTLSREEQGMREEWQLILDAEKRLKALFDESQHFIGVLGRMERDIDAKQWQSVRRAMDGAERDIERFERDVRAFFQEERLAGKVSRRMLRLAQELRRKGEKGRREVERMVGRPLPKR